jgi:hypothetical protein
MSLFWLPHISNKFGERTSMNKEGIERMKRIKKKKMELRRRDMKE